MHPILFFLSGLIIGLLMYHLFFAKKSNYEPESIFKGEMTVEDATQLLNVEIEKLQTDYNAKIGQVKSPAEGEALKKSLEDNMVQLSMTYNGFMMRKPADPKPST
jgi:hypothetical protein